MLTTPIAINSKLPQVGTTIFTVMSALANECGAINLSQGFPDFQAEPALFEAVMAAMQSGRNQYAPMTGVPELRQAIATKVAALYGRSYDPDSEITVTAGATQALFTAIAAFVRPGDEVIVFEPVYDSYIPAIESVGGTVVPLALAAPDYGYDWDAVRRALSPRTRMLILNSPHNPTGRILSAADREQLAAVLDGSNVVVLSDEVYEHIVFDGATHHSCASHDALAARSLIVSSFGKTYHITGWKIAYCYGPAALMQEFRKVHQFNVFTVHAPSQLGLAAYMADPQRHLRLAAFYQEKRDFFRQLLAATPFTLLPCEGTYFQLVRYDRLAQAGMADTDFACWLTREIGVAAIPLSPFYRDSAAHRHDGVIRFCFAKQETTLAAAGERLRRLV